MAISESTASTYRSRLMTKLDLADTAQIIRFAIENGIAS
jgi:DNA-binding NarL/FixJ family response regulator